MKRFIVISAIGLAGCSTAAKPDHAAEAWRTPQTVGRTVYEKVTGPGGLVPVDFTLCELTRRSAANGVYTVRDIVGYTEEALEYPGTAGAFTYATLELHEAWSVESPKKVVVRFKGGPLNGITIGWDLSLAVGETIGAFIGKATPVNRNYYTLSESGIFHQTANGGHTNGTLFSHAPVSLDVVGQYTKGFDTDGSCLNDITAETDLVPAPATPVDRVDGKVTFGRD